MKNRTTVSSYITLIALIVALSIATGAGAKERKQSLSDRVPTTGIEIYTVNHQPEVIAEPDTIVAPTKVTAENLTAWQVISGGGSGFGSSLDYRHSGTISQTAVGSVNSAGLVLVSGFWQSFPSGSQSCCDLPADANGDGSMNIGDAVYIIHYVFRNGAVPGCLDEGDVNNDGTINLADASFIVDYIYQSGPAPVCP